MNEIDEAVPQLKFYEEVSVTTVLLCLFLSFHPSTQRLTLAWVWFQIKDYEKLDSEEERLSRSRQIYDGYIMKELLSCSHVRLMHIMFGTRSTHTPSYLFEI